MQRVSAFALGAAGNAMLAAGALRRWGSGQAGLRIATRSTGQAALLPFAPYFAAVHEERRPWLWAYAGAHATHAALIARLLRRHGHPAAGTPAYPASVGGGAVGYALLLLRLAGGPRPLADWYLLAAVQGVPIPHGYLAKGRQPVYAIPALVWLAAVAGRRRAAGTGGQP